MRLSGQSLCPQCFFEAQAACWPVNPFESASINRRERVADLATQMLQGTDAMLINVLTYRRIVISGTESSTATTCTSHDTRNLFKPLKVLYLSISRF
ncbi:hypothetical protein PAXRUDRAFT_780775 [Paxillus rubicundulus Ve08.2h10]|uniref:Unplaced genomic scaffold scaffold_2521, whole genome shotgun sequence n=1 Tax=Paxillus rubicundulus Ve08.2h10 TaxID=930991 RepID=A0A0D0D8I9_9AGAM|nr:hypothetical protein PAXRUDRAFT_780775 [Paxillus rubicundulus Ve08.2h10]